jgi:tRNA pseudouridine55 synthase
MIGFLNINKAPDMTSHDVVACVRRLVGRKVKVGHAGTLDPAATGVLPLAIGQATRLIEYLADAHKGYRAVIALGTTTTTDDAEGEPLEQRPVPPLPREHLATLLQQFQGEIMQVPPMYSALHHQGQRLYDLARAGQTVERPPRPVTIHTLHLLAADEQSVTLDMTCSKGTYVRSLARDLGEALGCGAHLAALERTRVGSFTVAEAVPLDVLQQAADIRPCLLPPEVAVADWPQVTLDAAQVQHVLNGRAIRLADIAGERARAHTAEGALLALLRRSDELWQPEKVLNLS